MRTSTVICAAAGCDNPVIPLGKRRPARFCSATCRVRAHRENKQPAQSITVEVDVGSAVPGAGTRTDPGWCACAELTAPSW